MLGLVIAGLAAMWGAVFFTLDEPFADNRRRHRLISGSLLMICATVFVLGLIYALTGGPGTAIGR